MRKTVMFIAVLALAGCDAGGSKTNGSQASAPQAASQGVAGAKPQTITQAPQAEPQWYIQMNSKEAISDTSAWLLERGYAPVIVVIGANQEMLVGPYETQAAAEEQRAALQAKVAKSHRLATPSVIQHSKP